MWQQTKSSVFVVALVVVVVAIFIVLAVLAAQKEAYGGEVYALGESVTVHFKCSDDSTKASYRAFIDRVTEETPLVAGLPHRLNGSCDITVISLVSRPGFYGVDRIEYFCQDYFEWRFFQGNSVSSEDLSNALLEFSHKIAKFEEQVMREANGG